MIEQYQLHLSEFAISIYAGEIRTPPPTRCRPMRPEREAQAFLPDPNTTLSRLGIQRRSARCIRCKVMWRWTNAPVIRDAKCPRCKRKLSKVDKRRMRQYTIRSLMPQVQEE